MLLRYYNFLSFVFQWSLDYNNKSKPKTILCPFTVQFVDASSIYNERVHCSVIVARHMFLLCSIIFSHKLDLVVFE